MSTTPRGTTGAAPMPPSDLPVRDLPIAEVAAGTPLYRVHRTALPPVFFGPGVGRPPVFRFDPASGRFGILYAALGPDAAMIETLLRQPQRRTVDWNEIAQRSLTILSADRPMRLVSALGPNLSRLGTTAALSTGPYEPCAVWSDALFDHPEAPDGILYASRHNPDESCIALFEKRSATLSIMSTTPLAAMEAEIGALLDRHGKSLFGAP